MKEISILRTMEYARAVTLVAVTIMVFAGPATGAAASSPDTAAYRPAG